MERKECLNIIVNCVNATGKEFNQDIVTEDTFLMDGNAAGPSLQLTSLETITLMSELETYFELIIDFDVWFIQIKDVIDYILDSQRSHSTGCLPKD
jgi:hypothetical protein